VRFTAAFDCQRPAELSKVIQLCCRAKRDIVLSVECGTIEQAERSIKHLKKLLK